MYNARYAVSLLLTCALAWPVAGYAGDWSLDLKGGLAMPMRTTPDGTYWQEAFEHKTRTVTYAYAVGLNYQYTPTLSFQAHWLDLGVSKIKGLAVADMDYDHLQHQCKANCTNPYYFKATDSLKGFDLTATYTWQRDRLKPFVKGGLAVLQHQATFRNENGAADHFTGILPELEVGAGVQYQWAYIELDYFQAVNVGGQNLPISTQQVVMFAGVKVPLF